LRLDLFNTALTSYGNSGVEYFEIMPSVKAMTAKSLGIKPILLAVLMLVTAKARLPQKRHQWLYLQYCPIIISQVSSILMIKFSLNGCHCPIKLYIAVSPHLPTLHNQP
jgi:hypothetical protein